MASRCPCQTVDPQPPPIHRGVGFTVARGGLCRAPLAADRRHDFLRRQFTRAQRVINPLARERLDHPRGVADQENCRRCPGLPPRAGRVRDPAGRWCARDGPAQDRNPPRAHSLSWSSVPGGPASETLSSPPPTGHRPPYPRANQRICTRGPKSAGQGTWVCRPMRSVAGRRRSSSRPSSRAVRELRPSAATRKRVVWPGASSPVPTRSFPRRAGPGLPPAPGALSAPRTAAFCKSSASSRLRLTAISPRAWSGSGRRIGAPRSPANSTRRNAACGRARTASSTPNRARVGQQSGFRQSPHTLSRGNTARSSTSVRTPAAAQNAAHEAPAGPPPTMIAS